MSGIEKLRAAVDKDKADSNFHDYESKFNWIIERAKHYAEVLGMDYVEVIDTWEADRRYWYMNYYQEGNQPKIEGKNIRVFDTLDEFKLSIDKKGFRCPKCEHASSDPYECDSDSCDWKAYGLFKTLGKGVDVIIKKPFNKGHIFKPVSWE